MASDKDCNHGNEIILVYFGKKKSQMIASKLKKPMRKELLIVITILKIKRQHFIYRINKMSAFIA